MAQDKRERNDCASLFKGTLFIYLKKILGFILAEIPIIIVGRKYSTLCHAASLVLSLL